jgi:hypothetical protein
METSIPPIFPIASSIESNEAQPPRPSESSTESFIKILDEQSSPLGGEDKGRKETINDNPDSTGMGLLPPIFADPIPPLSFSSPIAPELIFSGGNTFNDITLTNISRAVFNSTVNSSFPSSLPNVQKMEVINISPLATGILSEARYRPPLQQGKIVASEKGIAPPIQELLFDTEPDYKMPFFLNKSGNGSWGIPYSFSENFKGRDGVLIPESKFADIASPGYPNSGFSPEGCQDPGGSQKISGNLAGDLKIKFGPSSTESGAEEVYQQIGRKVIWSIQNNAEKIKINLDPPELGNIYMEISREKDSIKAILWADNPTAKVALEACQTQLQKIMQNEGFKLEQFNVFLQENLGSFQERKETPLNPDPWNADESKDQKPEMEGLLDLNILPPGMLGLRCHRHQLDVLI